MTKRIDFLQMHQALQLAHEALQHQEVPVGAVVMRHNTIIGVGRNRVLQDRDATAHAEIIALRQACAILQHHRLDDCDLFVTLEPCPMCAGAIAHARIRRLIYGAYDPKGGAVDHGIRLYDTYHHKPEVIGGVLEQECAHLLVNFFKSLR